MTADERALKVVQEFDELPLHDGNRAEMKCQAMAQLQCLIADALKEQDRDTRFKCAQIALNAGINQDCLHLECSLYEYGKTIAAEIAADCMEAKAV